MKKFLLALLLPLSLMACHNANADDNKDPRTLMAKIGGAYVFITNDACRIPPFEDKWKYKALVINEATQSVQEGCWGPVAHLVQGQPVEFIHIQWTPDDFSELYADAFLQPHSFVNPPKKKEAPKVEI